MLIGSKVSLLVLTHRGVGMLSGLSPNFWTIEKVVDKVDFSEEVGPWLLISNVQGELKGLMYVHAIHDLNYRVIGVDI